MFHSMHKISTIIPSISPFCSTRMAQSVGSNSLHFHDETSWRVVGAPAAFELVWANLRMKFAEKNARLYIL